MSPADVATSATVPTGRTGRSGNVVLNGVTRRFGELVAVDHVDLTIDAGSFLAILGPSGSGKTTTMRLIGGFEVPDEGSIQIAGVDVTDLPPYKRNVNTVFQRYGLFPHMSVEDNIAYGLRMKRVGRRERRLRAQEILELVQLRGAGSKRPGELSGGMMQRVALARALVNRPPVLLLDEPLGALDRKLREDMQIELRQLQTTLGTTFIYVTHDQDEALGMSDRLVVMRDGRIVQNAPPAEVYAAPASLWIAQFVGSSNSIHGIVRDAGNQLVLESDAVRLVAPRTRDDLVAGQRAVAIIRPERVRVVAAVNRSEPTTATNCVSARLEELLTVGSHTRAVAITAGGIQLTAQLAAQAGDVPAAQPGEDIVLEWEIEDVRLYPPEEHS